MKPMPATRPVRRRRPRHRRAQSMSWRCGKAVFTGANPCVRSDEKAHAAPKNNGQDRSRAIKRVGFGAPAPVGAGWPAKYGHNQRAPSKSMLCVLHGSGGDGLFTRWGSRSGNSWQKASFGDHISDAPFHGHCWRLWFAWCHCPASPAPMPWHSARCGC